MSIELPPPKSLSSASYLKSLDQSQIENWIDDLTDDEAAVLEYKWRGFWARPDQLAPLVAKNGLPWFVWLVLAGRGFGKTRCASEWVREKIAQGARRIAMVGPTSRDVRKIMVEGDSGILACCPPWDRPEYMPANLKLVWANGAEAHLYSADEPDRLRGPQHDAAICDEIAAWRYPEAWDMLIMGMRLGTHPQICATTTPRPIKLIRDLMAQETTAITTGSTFENRDNLAPAFLQQILQRYEGTRLGRQELYAEVLEDIPNALWTNAVLEKQRVSEGELPGIGNIRDDSLDRIGRVRACMRRVVVSIDPSGTKGKRDATGGDRTNDVGIVVVGKGSNGHAYVLSDLTCNLSPAQWGRVAVDAFHTWQADKIIAETNYGGALVENTIRAVDRTVPYKEMRASRGKAVRAEPVSGLYEQGLAHHLGAFPELENQMALMTTEGYMSSGSPDRLDALVWAVTELILLARLPPPAVISHASFYR